MISKKEITIGSIVTISKGKKHSLVDEPSEQSKRLLAIDDLRNDNLIRFTNDKKGTEVQPDDVLIAWDGANAGTIGYGKSGFIGSTIARLRFKERDRFYAPFIGAFLRSKFDYLRQTATGATIPHINRKALEGIAFQEIDFDDQKRIAHLLGKVEGLIARRKQHLQQLNDLLKSVFLEMFGDPVRNEKGWEKKPLSDFAKVKIGPFGSLLHAEDYISNGIPLVNPIHMANGEIVIDQSLTITDEKFNDLSAYHLKLNDVVVARRGEIGRCALVRTDDKLLCGTGSMFIRISEEYLPMVLQFLIYRTSLKDHLESNAKGVTMKNLNSSILEKMPVIFPPIALQNQFAAIVEKVESIKSRYQQSLAELETLYGALSQKAFKGELDLSRVPLLPEVPEKEESEEKYMDTTQPAGQLFELPVPADLAGLQLFENRKELLALWLTAWLKHLGDTPFSAQSFIEVAQQRLSELVQDDIQDWGVSDYEEIKSLVFKALADGHLTQTYNDDNNIIQIKAAQS